MSQIHGFVCGPRIYEIDGIGIEFPAMSGPYPLRKDGEPKQRFSKADKAALDKFWEYEKAGTLEQYRVGGGCRQF